jgi:hypothetical protein
VWKSSTVEQTGSSTTAMRLHTPTIRARRYSARHRVNIHPTLTRLLLRCNILPTRPPRHRKAPSFLRRSCSALYSPPRKVKNKVAEKSDQRNEKTSAARPGDPSRLNRSYPSGSTTERRTAPSSYLICVIDVQQLSALYARRPFPQIRGL